MSIRRDHLQSLPRAGSKTRWLAALLFWLASSNAGIADVYYVTVDGNDAGEGRSLETAWRTVSHAAEQARAGDTVHIKGGVYDKQSMVIANSGTEAEPIVFRAYRGSPVIRRGGKVGIDISGKTHIKLIGLSVEGFYHGIYLRRGAKHNVISDCRIFGNGWCGVALSASYNTLKDNVICHNSWRGIDMGGSYNRIYGNDISDNKHECIEMSGAHNEIFDNKLHHAGWRTDGDSGDGIRINANNRTGGNNIHHNRIYKCSRHGFVSYDRTDNNTISHNIIHDIANHGIAILGRNCRVTHNIVYNCLTAIGTEVGKGDHFVANNVVYGSVNGIRIMSLENTSIINNIVMKNTYGITAHAERNPICRFNCVWQNKRTRKGGEGNIEADPLFVDRENGDFHLKSQAGRWNGVEFVKDDVTSPCLDAGDPEFEFSDEPGPNGGRMNLGAYGNSKEASKSWRGQ